MQGQGEIKSWVATGLRLRQNRVMRDDPLHDSELAMWAASLGLGSEEMVTLTALIRRRTEATGRPAGTPLPPKGGQVPALSERFELGALLGAGGMSEVRQARDTLLERSVALKIAHSADAGAGQRFLIEARVAAGLQHPGILPVYDSGLLPDGRRWLAMREVQGRRLTGLLSAARVEPDRGVALRRLMTIFARVAEAVGFAHAQQIVHRDLKPDNIMVGHFGEVIVIDWGIACRVGDRGADIGIGGTRGYMSPEQIDGGAVDARSDVYALGVVLERILESTTSTDDELTGLCEACLANERADRPQDGSVVAQAAIDWLGGAQRRAVAQTRVARARALKREVDEIRARASEIDAQANAILQALPTHAAVDQKAVGWALEDDAAELRRQASKLRVDIEQQLQAAIMRASDLAEAREMLADYYRDRVIEAEAARDAGAAAEFEARLRATDPERHQGFLDGLGRLSLATDPPGADVWCAPYVVEQRRLIVGAERNLGQTPLEQVELPRGSHRLRIEANGRATVIYPVHLDRGEHWDSRPPGCDDPVNEVHLPPDEWMCDEWCYVPAGWFYSGGDRHAVDGLPRRRVWVDGFIIERDPLTFGALVEALNRMVEAGEKGRAEVIAPPPSDPSGAGSDGGLSVDRTSSGHFVLTRREASGPIESWPVGRMSWRAAVAWADWRAAESGMPWRLPHDLEREKAARGADGRWLPWGDHFDPTWANVIGSRPGPPARTPVGEPSTDVSPYGVRGMAGNVRDWCLNAYQRQGLPLGVDRLVVRAEPKDEEAMCMIRGGGYLAKPESSRAAGRFASAVHKRLFMVGVRLVCPYPAVDDA